MASRRSRRRAEAEAEPEPEPDQEEVEEEQQSGDEDEDHNTEEGGDDELVSLQFREELSWRPGRPIATGTLVTRLGKLSKELIEMDQDNVDQNSLLHVVEPLGSRNLIMHKDAGVKAKTASCLVEILRLCAPNAPFTEEQIQLIFALFIKVIVPGLQDPQHTYYIDYKHVLESLNDVKSILLLNDIENGDDLLKRLFSSCFDIVSSTSGATSDGELPTEVIINMTELLVTLIDEGTGISGEVIEVIMAQFLRAAPPGGKTGRSEQNGNQSTLLPQTEPEAYVMAKTICNSCTDKMSRYVGQYFSDVIMDASGFATKSNGQRHGGDDEDDEQPSGPSEQDLRELRKAHLLIRELWRAAPLVLQNVIPQVEAELSADNVHLRQIATEAIGDMISGIGAAGPPPLNTLDPAAYPPLRLADDPPSQPGNSVLTTPLSPLSFALTHPAAYQNFIGRRNDKIAAIRAAWTSAIGHVISTSSGGIGLSREEQADLVKALGDKLNDTDEKVRVAGVKAMELFDFRDMVTILGATGGVDKPGSVLGSLADRCRDPKPSVRVDAMVLLGKLWGVGAGEILAGQEAVIAALTGIPSRIMSTFYINDNELFILLDRVIYECLVPLSFPPPKTKGTKGSSQGAGAVEPDRVRAERILLLIRSLDKAAKRAFLAMQSRQPQFAKVLGAFVNYCEAYNGGVMDDDEREKTARLEKTIVYCQQFFPDPAKVKSDLYKFAKANDRRSYQLIRYMVASESDYTNIRRSINEMLKRVQGGPLASTLDTLIPLIYRSACIMFNRSNLPTFMDCSKTDKDGLGAVAHEVLNEISSRNPDLFKAHLAELCKELADHAPTDQKENDPSAADILRACSSYSKKYPKEIPEDKKFTQTLMAYALYGRPLAASKFAVNVLLAKKDDKSMVNATTLLQRVMKDWKYDAPHFLNKLATISQLELQAPKVTLDSDDDILDMTVQKLLFQARTDATDKDPGWVDDENMDKELQAKLLALKILVNRLRSTKEEEVKERAPPVFKLLRTLIIKNGEMVKTKDTPKHHRSRLRLRAAQLLLKLCTLKRFDDMLAFELFDELAYVAQDPEPNVRRGFVDKLQKYLAVNRLNYRFYTMAFLTAFEPNAEWKQRIETWIRSRVRSFEGKDTKVMETIVSRLISLLAHHPDYSPELDELVDHAKYILYYISNVATEDNIGLIYKHAERVKQTRDAVRPAASENLYVLSDLTQAVIRKWQEKKNWSLQVYPDKIGIPLGLYTRLTSHEEAMAIAQKTYIPDGIDERLDDLLKAVDRKKKRKSMDERGEGHPPAKKVRSLTKLERKEKPRDKPKALKPSKKPSAKPAKTKQRSTAKESSADRRRSNRANTSRTKYTERDSSDDDKEMLDGVAEWEYVSQNSEESGSDAEESEARSEPEAAPATPKKIARREAPAKKRDEEKAAEEEAEERPEVTPKSNGRKAPPAAKERPASKGRVAPKMARGRVAPKLKASPAGKLAAAKPSERPPETKAAKGKRAAKPKAKDVYDMDLDDSE